MIPDWSKVRMLLLDAVDLTGLSPDGSAAVDQVDAERRDLMAAYGLSVDDPQVVYTSLVLMGMYVARFVAMHQCGHIEHGMFDLLMSMLRGDIALVAVHAPAEARS